LSVQAECFSTINVRGFGPAPEASAGVRKHVDQPAVPAGDVVAAENGIDLEVAFGPM
jgi:protein-tyrosine-phosphatase